MATYRITDPSTGRKVKLTGDSPPTEEELNQVFSSIQSKPSLASRAYEALTIPEKVAKKTIGKLTGIQSNIQNTLAQKTGLPIGDEPTGNLTRDIIAGTPKTIGQIGEEFVPPFISRGSILTAGALKGAKVLRPLASLARKGVLSTLEKTSGIAPRQAGALEAAYQDPKLFFASGKKAAGKFYEAAKNTSANIFEGITKNNKIVDKAQDLLSRGAQLEPSEALTARKAVDNLISKKDTVKDVLIPLRNKLDLIAKADPNIEKGDAIVSRGVKASAIRQLLPTNVGGTFSSFRTGIGGAIATMLPGGKVIAPIALSPAVQGVGATAFGAGSKLATPLIENAGKVGATAGAALDVVKKKLSPDKAREFLKEAKKENRGKSDTEVREIARKKAKSEGYDIPKSK